MYGHSQEVPSTSTFYFTFHSMLHNFRRTGGADRVGTERQEGECAVGLERLVMVMVGMRREQVWRWRWDWR
mgnify:CR=1 FL=1